MGIGDYSGYYFPVSNLNLTTKDAKTIVDLYSKNSSVDYCLLIDEKATKDRILRTIRTVFKKANEEDIVVFFFSGHGFLGGLCAYDGDLSYAEVRKAMAKSKSKNKMMFVDACRSGGMRVNNNSQNAINAAKNANVMLFLSSRNNESSLERGDMDNGYFTTYLQKGLKGNADANRDRVITAKELFDFVHSGVSTLSGETQHPVMWGNFSDNMPVMKW
ncbi:MAG: caspase family protein [Bacteroides sp.]|nr:caspase family protein [Bacteroides sp.]